MDLDSEMVLRINLSGVNCYLIRILDRFAMVDSGGRSLRNGSIEEIRARLDAALAGAGCEPGKLSLVVLSHGHFDHSDNAAYLRSRYGAKIAMHKADAWMVGEGKMPDRIYRPLAIRLLSVPMMAMLRPRIREVCANFERFSPDILVDEGFDFSPFGWDARVVYIPGHSRGSIGVITADGAFSLSGDILAKASFFSKKPKPGFNRNMADESFQDLDASIARVRGLSIRRVYPGHGESFDMSEIQSASK